MHYLELYTINSHTYLPCFKVVEKLSIVNIARLVIDKGGKVLVPIFDWLSFFAEMFKRLPAIKNLRHFRVSSLHPGIVTTQACNDSEKTHLILKRDVVVDAAELSNIIPPKSFSVPRQWYLFEKMREFRRIPTQDVTSPMPRPS